MKTLEIDETYKSSFLVVDATAEKTCDALGITPDREIAIREALDELAREEEEKGNETGTIVEVADKIAKKLALTPNELFLLGLSIGTTIGYGEAMDQMEENMTSSMGNLLAAITGKKDEDDCKRSPEERALDSLASGSPVGQA